MWNLHALSSWTSVQGQDGWGARGGSHPHECQGCVCKQSPFTKESLWSRCFVSVFMHVSVSFKVPAYRVHGKVI